jgi:hypothetical protein
MYLAASAVATGNGSALSRGGRLMVLLDKVEMLRRLLTMAGQRRNASPIVWVLLMLPQNILNHDQ